MIEESKEPIIGMDNIPKLRIEIFTGEESLQINQLCENNEELIGQLIDQFPQLFKENHTVHDLEVKIELKRITNRYSKRDAKYLSTYRKM